MFILQTSHLDLLPSGLHDRRIPGPNAKVELKATAPGTREGTITLGGRTYRLTVAERSYGAPILGVDGNHDGKIDPSESLPMKAEAMQDQEGKPLKFFRAARLVKSPYGRGEVNLSLTYIPKFPSFMAYVDYGRKGAVQVGPRRYHAQLRDLLHRGDFSLPPNEKGQGIRLVLDVNGNGKFDSRGETFTVGTPFRISGQTYEARVPKPDGSVIEIRPSTAEAVEVPPPFVARRGHSLPAFTGTSVDGKTVRFPEDFRGKPLLIDVMGLWSNDTEEATPALVEFQKATGLAILGIGIGYPDDAPKLAKNAEEKGIDWPILFDKESWKGPIAQALTVNQVPARFLLDGEGRVLAFGDELDNAHLGATLRRHHFASSPKVDAMATIAVPADVKDKGLYREIQRRVRVDQSVRMHAMSGGEPEGFHERWEAVDGENLRWLKELLGKRNSWPGRSVLGEKGSHDLWLMVQHCDRDRPFQGHVLGLLAKAVKDGDAAGRDLAYLTDRVRVGQNLPQVYGTQLISTGGWLRPSPVEDEANLDKRRAEVGLQPLAEYLKMAGEAMRIPITPPKK